MDHREHLPIGAELVGDYRIDAILGQGGFGVTYKAEHLKLGQPVAIKEYFPSEFATRDHTLTIQPKSGKHAEMYAWGKARFLDEARTLARFDHPAIVRVSHVFEALNSAYMVLKLESGETLAQWLARLGRRPSQEELDRLLTPLLDALEIMHCAELIHRDLAPDNIIIRADGSPVLLDFGAARQAVAVETKTMTGVIKAGYSPPEQYTTTARLQGPWTDVYALGATLYRAVTGAAPDEAPVRQLGDRVRPSAELAGSGYRAGLFAAIDQALRLKPNERPQSMAAFRALLQGGGAAPATVAAPASVAPPRQAAAASSRGGGSVVRALALVALVLGLVGGGYVLYDVWQVEERARQEKVRLRRATEALIARCAALAAPPHAESGKPGVEFSDLKAVEAVDACARALAARPDDPELQFLLGRGKHKAENYGEARALYEKAAATGHAGAMTSLGSLYGSGRGVAQDYGRAREWFEKAAAKGHAGAMFFLGVFYDHGRGVAHDYGRAREWYEKAAGRGNADAMFNLGVHYSSGRGVAQDYGRAREWFEKAAAKGEAGAMFNLGALYRDGQGVARDYALARGWYERAAAKGYAAAMTNLASLYINGEGVVQDYGLAREWYEKAAAKGDADAMVNLGVLYANGYGVARDYGRARELWEKAAAKGDAVAMYNLGAVFHDGRGVALDYVRAREWWKKAAAKGHAVAMFRLGVLHENGHGVAKDPMAALTWYRKAAAAGNKDATESIRKREGK